MLCFISHDYLSLLSSSFFFSWNIGKRPAVEPSDFWGNRRALKKLTCFVILVFCVCIFVYLCHNCVDCLVPLATSLGQIGPICCRSWYWCSIVDLERPLYVCYWSIRSLQKHSIQTDNTTNCKQHLFYLQIEKQWPDLPRSPKICQDQTSSNKFNQRIGRHVPSSATCRNRPRKRQAQKWEGGCVTPHGVFNISSVD